MILENQLKELISEKHKNLSKFAATLQIPHSTMDSIVNRPDGFKRTSVDKAIQICDALNLDLVQTVKSNKLVENKKNPPSITDDEFNEVLYNFLIQKGFINPHQDLSDSDLRFLKAWFSNLNTWFENRDE